MQIAAINTKGGVRKTTLVMALADILDADIVEHDEGPVANIVSEGCNA
jgi:cellulose biosynthesis protein BcsQ